jgi:hypothetical protein
MKPAPHDVLAVVGSLARDVFTASGFARMGALNDALKEKGFDGITAKDRDEASEFAAMFTKQPTEEELEEAPDGFAKITIENAPQSPVILYVHGIGGFTLRHGVAYDLPVEALAALEAANIDFTKEK